VTPNQQALLDKLSAMAPLELENRRRAIVDDIVVKHKGNFEDPALELGLLEELAYITSTLRKRSAGPPKAAKPAKVKATIDDLI
jgi:hypothetical protein